VKQSLGATKKLGVTISERLSWLLACISDTPKREYTKRMKLNLNFGH